MTREELNPTKEGYYLAKTIENKWGVAYWDGVKFWSDPEQNKELSFGIKRERIKAWYELPLPPAELDHQLDHPADATAEEILDKRLNFSLGPNPSEDSKAAFQIMREKIVAAMHEFAAQRQPQPTAEGAEEILQKYMDASMIICPLHVVPRTVALSAMREFAAQRQPQPTAALREFLEKIWYSPYRTVDRVMPNLTALISQHFVPKDQHDLILAENRQLREEMYPEPFISHMLMYKTFRDCFTQLYNHWDGHKYLTFKTLAGLYEYWKENEK